MVNAFYLVVLIPWQRYYDILGVFLKSSDVGRLRDGFRTQVRNVRYAWVPIAMSHHTRRSRPMLSEAQSGWCLFIVGKPPGMCDRSRSLPRVAGVRRIGGKIPSAHANRRVEKQQRTSFYQD
jgi:hypothetical protein